MTDEQRQPGPQFGPPNPSREANPAGFGVATEMAQEQRKAAEGTMQRGVPVPPPPDTSG